MNEHEQSSPEPTMPLEQIPQGAGPQPGSKAVEPTPPNGSGTRRSKRLLANRATGWVVAGVLAGAVVGLSVALVTTSSSPTASFRIGVTAPGRFGGGLAPGRLNPGGGPFGGRIGPGVRGVAGTVDKVSASKFTMTSNTGQELTVDEQSSTTYRKGTSSASKSAVTAGIHVIVLGSTSGSTINATQVVILAAGDGYFGSAGPTPAM